MVKIIETMLLQHLIKLAIIIGRTRARKTGVFTSSKNNGNLRLIKSYILGPLSAATKIYLFCLTWTTEKKSGLISQAVKMKICTTIKSN